MRDVLALSVWEDMMNRCMRMVIAGFLTIVAFLSCATTLSPSVGASGTAQATSSQESEEVVRIQAMWDECKPRGVSSVYEEEPSVSNPYRGGTVSPAFLDDGVRMVRFVRYLAGLSGQVTLDSGLTDLAQHGAVLLARLGHLTHAPQRPKDMDQAFFAKADKSLRSSNLFYWFGKRKGPSDSVLSFMDDSDESNIAEVGHRCWVLSPYLGKTGFGYAETSRGTMTYSFVTMQVFDGSDKTEPKPERILWPSEGYFPSSFFSPGQAWSVHLRRKGFDLAKSVPRVRLVNVTRGREWSFAARTSSSSERFFAVASGNAYSYGGYSFVVIFRPDGIESYSPGDKYKVTIDGLVDAEGKPRAIEYQVEFFALR